MQPILKYLKKISEKFCSNYPNIKKCSPSERLYAIESTLDGITQANDECHQMIQILRKKLNLSQEDILEIWETEILK